MQQQGLRHARSFGRPPAVGADLAPPLQFRARPPALEERDVARPSQCRARGIIPVPVISGRRLLRLALALFTLEIGLFLLIFPWRSNWSANYLQGVLPLGNFWDSGYFRGAISGLGLVNVFLSGLEFSRFLRKI